MAIAASGVTNVAIAASGVTTVAIAASGVTNVAIAASGVTTVAIAASGVTNVAFEKSFEVAWAHLDAIGHMANTAYLDVVVDVRFAYFASQGFTPADFRTHGIGPVVRRDEVDYYREMHLMEPFTVSLMIAGLSPDASRFRLRNEIRKANGELAARVTSQGGWLDLAARKLVAPPEALAAALRALDRSEDFAPLESNRRAPA